MGQYLIECCATTLIMDMTLISFTLSTIAWVTFCTHAFMESAYVDGGQMVNGL